MKSQFVISSPTPVSAAANLKSRSVISSWGGDRYIPKVFTEQDISMLSAVLHSPTAIDVSVRIMDAFVAMRRTLASKGHLLTRLAAVERRQITDQTKNEARFNEIFAKMSEGDVPLAQIFYQGKFRDAKSLLVKLIRRAKKELVIIDASVCRSDAEGFSLLGKTGI